MTQTPLVPESPDPLSPPPTETSPPLPRNASSWATKVDRLQVEPRDGVSGANVAGRRLTGPIQGFG